MKKCLSWLLCQNLCAKFQDSWQYGAICSQTLGLFQYFFLAFFGRMWKIFFHVSASHLVHVSCHIKLPLSPPKNEMLQKRVKADLSFNLGHIHYKNDRHGFNLITLLLPNLSLPFIFTLNNIWMIFQHQRIMRNPGKGTHLSPTAQQPRWEKSWEKTFE